MERLWKQNSSRLVWDGEARDLETFFTKNKPAKEERFFYIPAQRVVCLRDGWPRPFTDYSSGDPYVVRQFSERLRLLMENEFASDESLFPRPNRLKSEYRQSLADNVFSSFELFVETSRSKKRLVLRNGRRSDSLPYMVWSAGQREFVPLLLGFYWLLPAGRVQRRDMIDLVVIEELEMGLHPRAILTTMLLILDLLSRGYRVALSTHYPLVLDVIWALRRIKEKGGDRQSFARLFDTEATQPIKLLADQICTKDFRVYFFESESRKAIDISNLDPASGNEAEAGWGGLTGFSGRIADVISDLASEREQ